MRYLTASDILRVHQRLIATSGSPSGVRDPAALESCVGQPFQTFGGEELYESFVAKAAALAFFLIRNHPFVDGNKRVGHAALEVTLAMNGLELAASVDEQEATILSVADGSLSREAFTTWVNNHLTHLSDERTRATLTETRDFPLIAARMTRSRASRIRALRVDESYTWRMIAQDAYEQWGNDAAWEPLSNQLAGMELCGAAAEFFGEDFLAPPWNGDLDRRS